MKYRTTIQTIALACAVGWGNLAVQAAESDAEQVAAIRKTAEAFVAAYQKGDAQALADFWTPDGDYVDENGGVLRGRKAIADSFAELFASQKGLKLRIDVASLRFPTPDFAIEDGTTAVLSADGTAPRRARYTNLLVKKDGKWLLSSVREAAYAEPSNFEFLRGLDWMVGDWVDDTDKVPAGHLSFEWAPGHNFLVATRTAEFKDVIQDNGVQWIGWDPVAKQIRSWSFEADGGFGQAVWRRDGEKWIVKINGTVANGSKVTGTIIVTPVNPDTVTWQFKDRSVNEKPIPDTKEIKMKRVQ